MTDLLLRLFVKHASDTSDPAVRAGYGRLAGVTGIVCNLLLFALKLLAGTISGSVSITADAVNNLSDASGSIVTLVGFKLASRPADDEHPYGPCAHGIPVGPGRGGSDPGHRSGAGQKLGRQDPASEGRGVFGADRRHSGLFHSGQALDGGLQRKLGRRIGSAALTAAAADSRNDVISTGAVLLACIVGQLTGLKNRRIRRLLVALFILWSGVGIAKDTIDPLIGAKPDESLVHAIAYLMTSHPNILGIHDLMVHDYGPGRRFASVHAELDHRIDPLVAHEILDEIERQAKRDLHVDLVIHYDPIVTDDPEVTAVHTRVTQILRGIDPRLSIHDFRMVSGPHHANVIFDMVIPAEYEDKTAQLRREVEAQLQDGKKVYHLVITFDTAAFNKMTKEAQG